MSDDFTLAVRVAAIAGRMSVESTSKLERDLRKEYGGQRRYIARNAPAESAQCGDEITR
jgi:hypothetical protein